MEESTKDFADQTAIIVAENLSSIIRNQSLLIGNLNTQLAQKVTYIKFLEKKLLEGGIKVAKPDTQAKFKENDANLHK